MAQHTRSRETQQRRVVFETLKNTKSHPTADWIFERVRATMPKISLGTVYRNLNVLKQEGLINELYGSDRRARYDADLSPHAHFVCAACNEIRDVPAVPDLDWRSLKELVGCQVTTQRVEFLGYCPACARKHKG